MRRLKGWPLLRVTLLFKKLAGRINRLEEIGDTLYLPVSQRAKLELGRAYR
jgi:hypothetical protein